MIPVWDDYVHWLPEAVASVREQDMPADIIVVDNASAAPVPALEGVDVVRTPRRLSAGAARNFGLAEVESEYVTFLDADDLLPEGTLGHLASQLAAHPEAAVGVSSIVEAETGQRHSSPRPLAFALARHPRLFAAAHSVWSLYPTQGCAMARTGEVRDAGGYGDASGGEDWVLGVSLAFRGRVVMSERVGLIYRAGDATLSRADRSAAELARRARMVRRRIRSDGAVPRWAHLALPLVAVLQLVVIYGLRPAYRALRSLVPARAAPGDDGPGKAGQHREGPPEVGGEEPRMPPAGER